MAEALSITILKNKRDEITSTIANYEKKLATARVDLSHVNAAIRLFEASLSGDIVPYIDLGRLFKRTEIPSLCEQWLREDGALDTRQLTQRIMEAKGLDATDKVLFYSILTRVSTVLGFHARRGRFKSLGRRNRACVWDVADY